MNKHAILAASVLMLSMNYQVASADSVLQKTKGLTAGFVLDKLEDKVNAVISHAMESGSMVSSKAARDLQMTIQSARIELHDELDDQWDNLNSKQVDLLRELDTRASGVENIVGGVQNVEDTVFLDTSSILDKLNLSDNTPAIRRVDGATLIAPIVDETSYPVTIRGNFFSDKLPIIRVDGKNLDPSLVSFVPPYSARIVIPSRLLESHFQDARLSKVPVQINTSYRKKRWLGLWQETAKATLSLDLQLMPRYPLTYRVTELYTDTELDKSTEKLQLGAIFSVPGTGKSGRWQGYRACTDTPPGSQPIRVQSQITAGLADGGWWRWGPKELTPNGGCSSFENQVHDRDRQVRVDVFYYPLVDVTRRRELALRDIALPNEQAGCGPTCPAGKMQYGRSYVADFSSKMTDYEITVVSFWGKQFVLTRAANAEGIKTAANFGQNSKRLIIEPLPPW